MGILLLLAFDLAMGTSPISTCQLKLCHSYSSLAGLVSSLNLVPCLVSSRGLLLFFASCRRSEGFFSSSLSPVELFPSQDFLFFFGNLTSGCLATLELATATFLLPSVGPLFLLPRPSFLLFVLFSLTMCSSFDTKENYYEMFENHGSVPLVNQERTYHNPINTRAGPRTNVQATIYSVTIPL